jgi:hypothetical protein
MKKSQQVLLLVTMAISLITVNFAQAQNPSAPKMPTFDEVTVRHMLNTIDEERNFTLLRAGYFGGHRKSPFPATDGFAVLKSTLATQKPGDLKWFLLESLRGSAAFHAPDIPLDDGFEAYGLIFDSAHLATTSQIQTDERTSVRDFVSSIDTSLKRKGYPSDPRVADLLVKAWNVWNSLPPSAADANRPIDWSRAIAAAYAQDKFTTIVEAALKDTAHPPDFSMLKLAVVVVQDKDAPRAIDLLKTAQSKLPPDDVGDQKWLYQTWTQLITGKTSDEQPSPKVTDKTQLAALVEMRKDQISYTGSGYADLLGLYWRLGQNDKAADLMKVIPQPGVHAEEKIDVAKVLLMPPQDIAFSKDAAKQMQAQGVDLLQTYLATASQENPPNPRVGNPLYKGELDSGQSSQAGKSDASQNLLSVKNQLQARYLLGRYYMQQDMITEAGKALQTGDLKPPFHSSESDGYYYQIVQLRAELEKKLAGVEGVK